MGSKGLTEQEAFDEVAAAMFDIVATAERPPSEDGWRTVNEIWEVSGDKTMAIEVLRRRIERKVYAGIFERMTIGRKVYYRILSR